MLGEKRYVPKLVYHFHIDERTPDHSVLLQARARFGATTYRAFFTEIVRQCEMAGLAPGNRLYVDSTPVKANAGMESVGVRTLVEQHLADVEEHVEKIRPFVDAGFTEVALVQIGGESQPDFIAWAQEKLLPALRSL